MGFLHAPGTDLVAVDEERGQAAFADAAAVVGKLQAHLVLSGGDGTILHRFYGEESDLFGNSVSGSWVALNASSSRVSPTRMMLGA